MDHTKILDELFHHDRLARRAERELLRSQDRQALSRTLIEALGAARGSGGLEAEDRLVVLAGLLARAGTAEAARALFELFESDSEEVVQAASDGLIELGDERFDLLDRTARQALERGASPAMLAALSFALAEVDHPDATDLLILMLDHPDPLVVVAALEVAGEQGWDDRIWQRLVGLTQDQRDVTVEDETEGPVTLAVCELASEVVEALRAVGRGG